MKVTFPHLGTLQIAIQELLNQLDVDYIAPPPPSKRTMEIGVRYAPELACLPLKVNLGNFIEALELGADTLVICGGCGPCRLGYYAQIEEKILRDLGYQFDMIVLEPHPAKLWQAMKRLAPKKNIMNIIHAFYLVWSKVQALDTLEQRALSVRPRELIRGTATKIVKDSYRYLTKVHQVASIRQVMLQGMQDLDMVPVDYERRVLNVGVVGEIYVAMEPFVNQDLDERLGEMGVEIHKTLFMNQYLRNHILPDWQARQKLRQTRRAAFPYLQHFVGGHGIETIGESVLMAQDNIDGVIQLLPFSCMPEIVAKGLLPQVSREYGIPVMTIILDEHSGEAGMITRLEAFIDLMRRRREYREERFNGYLLGN